MSGEWGLRPTTPTLTVMDEMESGTYAGMPAVRDAEGIVWLHPNLGGWVQVDPALFEPEGER